MCQLFHDLKEIAIVFFPGIWSGTTSAIRSRDYELGYNNVEKKKSVADNKEVRYSVISGFIFLRFFAPAILGPKLFGLTSDTIVSNGVGKRRYERINYKVALERN
jgi:Ras GTPase-activating protein 3